MFAIIGGTGVYDSDLLDNPRNVDIDTPYGKTKVTIGTYKQQDMAFMARHGSGHKTPPHLVNYRANIWALREIGVTEILATAAVGSIRPEFEPGTLLIVDDFIDFTKCRPSTFHEGADGVVHVDMTDPYCRRLRDQLFWTAQRLNIPIQNQGVYVCTEGPRFETRAEIRAYAALGGDVVGMTSVPEVVLAREAEICYATVGIVTNFCSGVSENPLTVQEVMDTMAVNAQRVKHLFFQTIESKSNGMVCECRTALREKGAL